MDLLASTRSRFLQIGGMSACSMLVCHAAFDSHFEKRAGPDCVGKAVMLFH